ncbi:MAG: lytic murein transglycosylase, partial [Boseongicola sp.]|nr:lytic murein transglycosylase [Boseongicola sp.]
MKTLVALTVLLFAAASAGAQPCGGPFDAFLDGIRDEATRNGHSEHVVDRFLEHAAHDPKVIRADRAQ